MKINGFQLTQKILRRTVKCLITELKEIKISNKIREILS